MLAASLVSNTVTEVLNKTYPDAEWLDVVRWVVAVLTSMLLLMYARIAFGRDRPQSGREVVTIRIGILSFMAALIPVILTALASIGQPVAPWRLPCFALVNIFGWWYVCRRL